MIRCLIFIVCLYIPVSSLISEENKVADLRKPYREARQIWAQIENNLKKNAQLKGMIGYEKESLEKLLKFVIPINQKLDSVKLSSDKEKLKVLRWIEERRKWVIVLDQEYKRAVEIRKLLYKISDAEDQDLRKDLEQLPALSSKLLNLDVELIKSKDAFGQLKDKLDRQATRILLLKAKSKSSEEAQKALDLLRAKYPEEYKKIK